MTRRRKQTTNSAACFAAKQITFALLALNKFLQLLAKLITTNKCNLWMHYSVSCPGDRAHLSWKDTPNANSAGVKGTSVTCTNTIHKNNLVKMCLLCTGLRTPEQWLLMELLSKPTLSCSCGHCCARGQPALRFQPDFVSCRQLELPGACLNQIKEKQNRMKGLPWLCSFTTGQSSLRFLQHCTDLCSWASIWMGIPVGYGLVRAGGIELELLPCRVSQ